jgi:hypothetical protein
MIGRGCKRRWMPGLTPGGLLPPTYYTTAVFLRNLLLKCISDICRYLDGETIQPSAVFAAIHDVFKTYVDFRSDIESRFLTLWTIGIYFYTMFPAYPYLALNGPKNSGKSMVMRVLQPLAFNMITTSDPTVPSMFRVIHQTSCTVGIDEAERYHNPKDPGMQQSRQLLNSGYKQGMPAIHVKDDLKPQAFDVYSSKILATITGLEDILASRCIAIPMRCTTRKMPSFPPDFVGVALHHHSSGLHEAVTGSRLDTSGAQ